MSSINIKFIGKDYTIPEDVLLYIDLLKITDSIKVQLVRDFVRLVSRSESGLIDDNDMSPYINSQTNRFITLLCDNGIYDRTVNDYLRNNKGYQLFSDVNKAALNKIKSLLMRRLDDMQSGVESALYKKESSVTGVGFSIWSSSFVNHAIYAAMQASTINKQEKAASQEYQREVNSLCSKLESNYDRDRSNYIKNEYIPNMETAFTLFAYELLDKYISDLISNDKFDNATLSFVDTNRSNDLLENLKLSDNKLAILENAFLACPYNAAVYMAAMRCDLLDVETFQTAKTFKCDDTIISFLESHWGEVSYPKNFDINYHCIDLLALYTDKNPKDILREYTQYYANSVVEAYSKVAEMCANEDLCNKAVRNLNDDEVLSGEEISNKLAKAYVNNIVSNVVWEQLINSCGYTKLFEKIKKHITENVDVITKKDIDDLYIKVLTCNFEKARQKLIPIVENKRKEEACQKEAKAEKARFIAERKKKIKTIGFIAIIVVIVIAIVSLIITKINNAKAYQNMAGEFCVYRVINEDGKERDEFNWWLSISEDGTIKMSSWSYAFDNTTVNSYSGEIKNKADFRKFEGYRIGDYCADVSEYEDALYCYEFYIADEWDEFEGYIVCWQYHNGKILDIYCDDYRYSFVETNDDYRFNKWESEINSDKLSKNVQKLIDNIDVSEEDVIEEIENLIISGNYNKAVETIVSSKLSDNQKNVYFDSLVERTDFKSFDVNGLVINIPEHWYIENYSNPNIRSARDSEKGSRLTWSIKYVDTIDQVIHDGNDGWKKDNDYSPTTIIGCEEAYIRCESNKKVDAEEVYSVIDYYIVCQNDVYKIQYFAYDERFFEPEMHMLLEYVEFNKYAENRINIQEQNYLNAIELFDEGKYEEALSIFTTLEGYKESEQKITECNNAIIDGKYNSAISLINKGMYKEALVLLDEVGDYKDATDLKQKYELLTCETGDVITFGSYEQDNNLDNGAEAIEWLVLERKGNQALIISKYCIEQKPFNDTFSSVLWENCTLRKWLNDNFLSVAFSKEEQTNIVSSNISTEGKNTTDKIFLLSEEEAVKYFDTDYYRKADATEYVSTSHCYWLLRTTGSVSNVAFVDYNGKVGYYENVDRNWWVRPAMWIVISE